MRLVNAGYVSFQHYGTQIHWRAIEIIIFAYFCQEFVLIDIPKMKSSSINRSLPSGVTSFITGTHGFPWLSIGPSSWKNWTVTHRDPIPVGRTRSTGAYHKLETLRLEAQEKRDRKTGLALNFPNIFGSDCVIEIPFR